jgi:hypothetical protein
MRTIRWCCIGLVLGLCAALGQARASEGFDDLTTLIKSGVEEDVVLTYIDNAKVAYDLSVDEILYLNDLGVSAKIINAAVQHGKDLRASGEAPAPAPEVAPVEAVAAAPVEAAAVVVAPPPEELNVSYFYGAMAPYGNWVEVDGVAMWQPTVVLTDHSWRPYFHRGHWVLTDAGWCWESDYSWGWAPFHYGRWSHHGVYGWVWAPDVVWAPAWVSWRSSDSHWGWAPLPYAARFEVGVGFHFGGHVGVNLDFGLGVEDFVFVGHEHFADRMLVTYA